MPSIDCRLFSRGVSTVLPLDDVSEHITDPTSFIWIELQSPDSQTIRKLGEEFGLHELALEDAIATRQRPKLEEYGEHLFIALRTVQLWQERVELGETHLFVGANFVIAIRHDNGCGYQRVAERLNTLRNGHKIGASYTLYLMLDLIVDQLRPVIERMQASFQTLENLLIAGAELGRENLERLYALKRELTVLRDATEPLQEIIEELIRVHPELVTKELRAYFRDVADHAMRASVTLNNLRTSTSDAMQFHLALMSLEQNDSVKKLAGWAALLALPTVVFSLYGMNFKVMPELNWPWAYPTVLALTGLAAVGLHRRLKKRGWI
jgi:magnesium transporter